MVDNSIWREQVLNAVLTVLLSAIAVFVTAHILPGARVEGFGTAVVVAVVLGFVNAFIRPIILLLTLPINVLTLGLFTFVIMALIVLGVSAIVPGFHVNGFWWALAFALVLAVINAFLNSLKV
jgi:putative membrane protein